MTKHRFKPQMVIPVMFLVFVALGVWQGAWQGAWHVVHAQTRVDVSHKPIELGRLLTTPAERQQLDAARQQWAVSANGAPVVQGVASDRAKFFIGAPEIQPSVWRVSGITQSHQQAQQRVTVWLDGKPYQVTELPAGVRLVRHKNGEILGLASRLKDNKTAFAKVGEDLPRPP